MDTILRLVKEYPVGSSIIGIIVLYLFTATVVYVSIRLKKDEHDQPFIDSSCWHFKMAFPFRRFSYTFILELRHKNISLCPYALRVFLMLYLIYPLLIIWTLLQMIVCIPIIFTLKGAYLVPDFYLLSQNKSIFTTRYNKVRLPKINNITVYPAYIVIPLLYTGLLFINSEGILKLTVVVLGFFLAIALIVGIVFSVLWLFTTDKKSVSMFRKTVTGRLKGFCPLVRVK